MESVRLYLGCLMMMAFVYCVLSANCNSLDDLKNQVDRCYTQHGFQALSLQINSGSASLMAGLTGRFGADACSSKRSDVIDTVRCVLQVYPDCGSFGSIPMPSPDVAEDMVNLECQQRSTDLACVTGSVTNSDVTTCQAEESRKLASRLSSMDTTQMVCASFDASAKCMQPAIEMCGSAAVSYMAEYTTGPFRPKACSGGTAIMSHPVAEYTTGPFRPKAFSGGTAIMSHPVAEYTTGPFRPKACSGGTTIMSYPVMLFFSLFAIMLRFYMA